MITDPTLYVFLQTALQIAPVLNINLYIRALCSAIPQGRKGHKKHLTELIKHPGSDLEKTSICEICLIPCCKQ